MSADRLRDENGRMAAVRRLGALEMPREEAFDEVVRLVCAALDVPMAAVTIVGPRNLCFKAATGLEDADTSRAESFDTVAIGMRQPLVVPDAENDPRFADSPNVLGMPYVKSYIGVPLQTADGYNLGTVAAYDTKRRGFTEVQVAIMEKMAALVMDQIELRQAARPDALTGALSRAGFRREVEREVFRCARYGRPASVVIFNLDTFAALNERFGHEVGDQVLQAIGRTCLGTLRLSDAFGRLGGEEFGLLLPETGSDDALICAERLRAMIEKIEVRHEGAAATITASFGVAALGPEVAGAARWLAMADVACHQAKRAGRNRVVNLDTAHALAPASRTGEPQQARIH